MPFGRLVAEAGIPTARRDIRHLKFPNHARLREYLGNGRTDFFGRGYTLVRAPREVAIADVVEIVR